MNILLVCQCGMSSGLLMQTMQHYAEENNLDLKVNARNIDDFMEYIDGVDIVLIGPQIKHREKEIRREMGELHIPVLVLEMKDYGMANGGSVIETAAEYLKNK